MTFLTIMIVLIIGLLMLIVGFATQQRWLKLFSIIPLAISLWQLINMLLIS